MSEENSLEGRVSPERLGWQKFVRESTDDEIVDQLVLLKTELDKERQNSITDNLTGLLNKRGITEAWKRIFDHLQRHPEENPGTVVLIDLNNFKTANDKFGHAAGDRALQILGEILRRYTRPEDMKGRLGGDEFVCHFDGADEIQSQAIMERISELFVDQTVKEKMFGGESVVTLSWGIATIDRRNGPSEVTKLADERMYVHKNESKSGVIDGDDLESMRNLGFDK